jgi:hypothetical protein
VGQSGSRFLAVTNGVQESDIVEIAAGGSFDPYEGRFPGVALEQGKFEEPGRYTASFHYATHDSIPDRWASGPCVRCDVSPNLRHSLERVTPVDLTATASFEVAP